MLVLSRKEKQTILFPNLGVSVQVLRIAGNTVRIGVEAPREVDVFRGELRPFGTRDDTPKQRRSEMHRIRNQLNSANLALHLVQKQLESGQLEEAERFLDRTLQSLADLEEDISQPGSVDEEKSQAKVRRALVVEDNANERELLAGYLRLCGYEVDVVEDGQAAMAHLSSHESPDVVLLDMQMPRMDGPQTVSAIRQNPRFRGMKLFAVSGMDRVQSQVPIGEHGVNRWFSKPLKPAEFATELNAEFGPYCAAV